MRDSQAIFLKTLANQVHNQVMRIKLSKLFDSLLGNHPIHTGKTAKLILHNAKIFYYTQSQFQNQLFIQLVILSEAKNLS